MRPGERTVEVERREVLSALKKALKPNQTLISRFSIEAIIKKDPKSYPVLTTKSQRMIRRSITKAMDAMFTNDFEGRYRRSWVWNILNKNASESVCISG